MGSTEILMLVSICIYLVGMLVIGLVYSKNQTSAAEFYLGGRRLGPLVTALSTEASDMSAWLLMGVPGLAFFCGIAEASWTAIGLIIGTYLNWLFVAKRLRRYSVKVGAITVPDFLARRFRDKSKVIETLGALMIIVFFVPYTASGFVACGKLFHGLMGFDYTTAMIVSAAVIVAYTSTGGFMAASVTSLVQSLVMTATLGHFLRVRPVLLAPPRQDHGLDRQDHQPHLPSLPRRARDRRAHQPRCFDRRGRACGGLRDRDQFLLFLLY